MKKTKRIYLAALAVLLSPMAANADTIFADVVIDFFDSGAGPISGPYGGDVSAVDPIPRPVPTTFAADGDTNTFVSLPTGSYITLGFSSGFVFDGTGNDLFVSEIGAASELANIFISSDFGLTFTFLGAANGGLLTELDFASIGFTGNVNAVKIVGLDSLGASPGFDVQFVQGLEGSASVPEPGTLALLGLGLVGMAARRRKTV